MHSQKLQLNDFFLYIKDYKLCFKSGDYISFVKSVIISTTVYLLLLIEEQLKKFSDVILKL